MRGLPVNLSYGLKTKLSFGKFKDDNAREVVREALASSYLDKDMQDSLFKIIKECDFFEAYTDKKDNTVKGRFADKFVKSNADNKHIKRHMDSLKRNGILNNLSIFDNVDVIAKFIPDFEDMVKGIDISQRYLSKNPHGDARIEEKAKEDFLNNLAD